MDLRRHASIDEVYFGVGDDTRGKIVWFVAPADAEWFSCPTVFRSLDWWDGLGPLPGRPGVIPPLSPYPYSKGATPAGYRGTGHICGEDRWWIDGIPSPPPANPVRNPAGVPECCVPGFGAFSMSATGRAVWNAAGKVVITGETILGPGGAGEGQLTLPPSAYGAVYLFAAQHSSLIPLEPLTVHGATLIETIRLGNELIGYLYRLPDVNSLAWAATPFGWFNGAFETNPQHTTWLITYAVAVGMQHPFETQLPVLRAHALSAGTGIAGHAPDLGAMTQEQGEYVAAYASAHGWSTQVARRNQQGIMGAGANRRTVIFGESLSDTANQNVADAWVSCSLLFVPPGTLWRASFTAHGTAAWHSPAISAGSFAMTSTSAEAWAGVGLASGSFAMTAAAAEAWVGDGLPAIVQVPTGATGTTSVALTWTSATTAGNHLQVAVAASSTTATPTITPPAGWTLAKSVPNTRTRVSIYYAQNAASQSTSGTFTVSGGSGLECAILGMEWRGLKTSGSLETNTGAGTGTSAAPNTGTASAWSQALDVGIAAVAQLSNASFSAATSGYTLAAQVSTGSICTLGMMYRRTAATANQLSAVTSTVNAQWSGAIVGFKE